MHRLIVLLCTFSLLFPLSGRARRDTQVEFVTSAGNFTVRLLRDTPVHSRHFEQLVRAGYYNGLLFHRVIRDFMIQAGDSTSRNAAAGVLLGEADRKETLAPEIDLPYHYHRRGALAMARESDEVNPGRRSSATQFYIVWGKTFTPARLAPVRARVDEATGQEGTITSSMAEEYEHTGGAPHLDGQYTVFGEVVKGLSVIDKIQRVTTDDNDRPLEDVRIISARVVGERR